MRVLHRRAQGQDGPGAHKQRNGVDGRGDGDGLAALHALVGPVVVPVGARGQVDFAAGRSLLRNRRYQERRPEHVFVAQIGDLGVIGEIQRQRAHERRPGLPGFVAERVDIRHQFVAQAQIFLQDRLGLLAVGPHFVVRAAAVGAHDGQERRVLEPARVELGEIVIVAHRGARIGWDRAAAGARDDARGADHCQPPVSFDQYAMPEAVKSRPVGIWRL